MAQGQRFVHFIQQLSPTQFKLLALLELRHHVVIVGIKPFSHLGSRCGLTGWSTATTNTEQRVYINRAISILVALWNVTQQQAGCQDMVIPSEITYWH